MLCECIWLIKLLVQCCLLRLLICFFEFTIHLKWDRSSPKPTIIRISQFVIRWVISEIQATVFLIVVMGRHCFAEVYPLPFYLSKKGLKLLISMRSCSYVAIEHQHYACKGP